MVKFYESIEKPLEEWAMQQAVFFVASAPSNGRHVNLSPKGLPATSFSILNPNLCGYVDATGSGIETVSHIHENGRVTVMFCSFEASPRIMRFFCTGRVVEWNDPGFDGWLKRMGNKNIKGARAVIVLDVFKVREDMPAVYSPAYTEQVQTSCGYAVPYLALKQDPDDSSKQIPYLEDRHTLGNWADKQVAASTIDGYRAKNNSYSLDGLPGLKVARRHAGHIIWYDDLKTRARDHVRLALVAFIAAFLTVLSLYVLGLTTFPTLEIKRLIT